MKSTVSITGVRLRWRSYPDGIPALKEILCTGAESAASHLAPRLSPELFKTDPGLLTHARILIIRKAGPYRSVGPVR